ncbi:MAG: malonyl-CoA synthase [Verrucomicrobia bacterium]|nr:malonyl-CoA synthase [Verrucomicrobiota bacterium]
MNLYSLLESGFPKDRDTTCLEVPNGRNRTWTEIDQGSARIAQWLASLSLPLGSRVAATIEKSPEGLMLYLATLRAGLVFLPLNTAYRDSELDYFFGNATPSVVICPSKSVDWILPIAKSRQVAYVMTLDEDGSGSLMEEAAHFNGTFTTVDLSDDALASILYTSGTTGRSKGAMLTHGNLGSNASTLRAYWGWSSDDVLLHMLPIFHIHGLFVGVNGALLAGAKMIWLSKFDAKAAVQSLPKATVMMGVPTFYVRLLAEGDFTQEVCQNIRLFISGSAPLLLETFLEFRERSGHTILERYGMSETGMLASNPYFQSEGQRYGGTVGKPLPGVSIRITGEDGQPCKLGEIGLIEVRGPNIFKGYWEMPDKTREEFTADGWFRTGDMGRFGGEAAGHQVPDDYLSIVGRGKDLIISGGFNVYPKEIEGFIDDIPGVEESAVVGVPHPDFGEAGVAVVVAKAGMTLDANEIQSFLKTKIANFKVPKKVVIVKELPRNTMGKVQKNLLRDEYKAVCL